MPNTGGPVALTSVPAIALQRMIDADPAIEPVMVSVHITLKSPLAPRLDRPPRRLGSPA